MNDFDNWVEIPGGQVTLAEGGYLSQATVFDVEPFAIGRYPVTNTEYASFIEAGGYGNRTWWSDEGWRRREKEGWAESRFWRDRYWNRPEWPVVGVSWYEWEWCLTGWDSGATVPSSEPRLLRGGSWSSDSPLSLRVTNRSGKDPNTRLAPGYRNHVTVGFRCVRF